MVVRDYSVKRVFVGRSDELSMLKDLFKKVQKGIGQIVIIKGEHGIGKTRFVEEFKKYLETESAHFLGSSCKRTAHRNPYQPFIEALDFNIQVSSNGIFKNNYLNSLENASIKSDLDDEVGEKEINDTDDYDSQENGLDNILQAKPLGLIPLGEPAEQDDVIIDDELEPLKPALSVEEPLPMGLIPTAFRITEGGDIKTQRTYLFDIMTKHLFKLTETSPVVLFIDDLHWASQASLGYLEYLTEHITKKPIMLLFSLNTDELGESNEKIQKLNEILQKFGNQDNYSAIMLHRFDIDTVSSMIKKMFSHQDVPDSFINQIYSKTEGNPFFIEDVLGTLIDEDVIDVTSRVWQTRIDISKITIPDTTHEVLITRLRKLDKSVLKILGYAGVIGREFSFDLLDELTEIPEEQLLDAIDVLLEAKLIYEDLSSEIDQYKFNNPIIQNMAYNELSRSRRRFLNTKIGTILERQNINDVGKVVFKLADHFSKGRNYEKALKYLILAGDRTAQIYAIDDARRYYLTALELLNKFEYNIQTQQREIELLSNLGYTCKMLGDWDQAMEYYRNIPNLIENLRNKLKAQKKGQKPESEVVSQNWIQLKMADTYWNLAELMRFKSDWDNAERNYKKSLTISQEVDDYHGIAQAERGRGDIYWRKGEFKKALDHFDICIDFATKINDLPVIAVTYIDIGNIYNYTDEREQAIAYYKESIEHLDKIGWLHEMGRAYNGLGEVYTKQEKWSEAIKNFKKSEEISNKIGDSHKRAWALFNSAECHAKMKNLDKAMEACQHAEEILMRLDDRIGLGLVARNFGIIYHYKKNYMQSEEYFNKSIKLLKQLKVPFELGTTFMEYGLMLTKLGDKSEARKCLEYSLKVFKDMDAKIYVQKLKKLLTSKQFKSKHYKMKRKKKK